MKPSLNYSQELVLLQQIHQHEIGCVTLPAEMPWLVLAPFLLTLLVDRHLVRKSKPACRTGLSYMQQHVTHT